MVAPVEIDPVAVVVALASAAIGPQLAAYVGPYVVIAASGLIGAAFALGRRPADSRLHWTLFVVGMTLLSMLFTVPVTEVVHHYADLETRWVLSPVALGIAWVGSDWGSVFSWIGVRLGRLIERRTNTGEQ